MATILNGTQDVIREAKLYFTAFRKAYQISVATNAERWTIGDEFIAEHKDDPDSKGKPNPAFELPPRPPDRAKTIGLYAQFWAGENTQPGDAEKTYKRLMTELFPLNG